MSQMRAVTLANTGAQCSFSKPTLLVLIPCLVGLGLLVDGDGAFDVCLVGFVVGKPVTLSCWGLFDDSVPLLDGVKLGCTLTLLGDELGDKVICDGVVVGDAVGFGSWLTQPKSVATSIITGVTFDDGSSEGSSDDEGCKDGCVDGYRVELVELFDKYSVFEGRKVGSGEIVLEKMEK